MMAVVLHSRFSPFFFGLANLRSVFFLLLLCSFALGSIGFAGSIGVVGAVVVAVMGDSQRPKAQRLAGAICDAESNRTKKMRLVKNICEIWFGWKIKKHLFVFWDAVCAVKLP